MDTRAASNRFAQQTRDLGRIEEPLLVCGGAYSNLEALEALIAAAGHLGIPRERVIHTGDMVAYCADPVATATLLRRAGFRAIQGNVEESLWASQPDCGCGFDAGTECDKLSAAWFAFADRQTDGELRGWMGGLPYHLTFTMAGLRVRVVHGSPARVNAFIYASTPAEILSAELDAAGADIVVAGHSGLPFTRRVGNRVWHNSGALGMPANDGTPRTWYSLMIPREGGVRFEHHALDYDHDSAREKMNSAGLPGGYADALASGLWPSLDALLPAEREQTGRPLDAEALSLALPALAGAERR